jgi:hypothetical protein
MKNSNLQVDEITTEKLTIVTFNNIIPQDEIKELLESEYSPLASLPLPSLSEADSKNLTLF